MSAVQPDDTSIAQDAKNLLISLILFALAVAIYGAAAGEIDTSIIR